MNLTPSPRKPLSAGSEIDAWCTRCKLDLGHRIVAMVGSAPKRVLCQTCGSEHNYRAPKTQVQKKAGATRARSALASPGKTSVAGKAGSTAKTKTAKGAYSSWEAMVRSGKPFRDYALNKRFEVGELIRHKKFGDGYVVALSGPQKLTIAFAAGEKTLIHDQSE